MISAHQPPASLGGEFRVLLSSVGDGNMSHRHSRDATTHISTFARVNGLEYSNDLIILSPSQIGRPQAIGWAEGDKRMNKWAKDQYGRMMLDSLLLPPGYHGLVVCPTCDCPVIICRSISDGHLAVVHASRPALAQGILTSTLSLMIPPLVCWVGPMVGQTDYSFPRRNARSLVGVGDLKPVEYFDQTRSEVIHVDLEASIDCILNRFEVARIGGSAIRTSEDDRYYSLRRRRRGGEEAGCHAVFVGSSQRSGGGVDGGGPPVGVGVRP